MRVNLEGRQTGYCDGMSAILERAATVSTGAVKPPMPREHGAWGILLIPFATAVGVAGIWNAAVTLLLASVVCFYIARTSWLKKNYWWTAALLAGCAVCAVPLLLVWKLWWLAAFGAVAAPLAFRKTGRSLAMQLLAVAGLTLTAPAAWYVATGMLDYRLWLLNVLYFAGGVFYVKMHVATAMARKPAGRWPVVIYYGALTGVFVWWPAGLAFVPAIVRAFVGVALLSPTLRIKRLGWTEVAHSIVFAVVLIALIRWEGHL
jgi:hypothetical protein